MLSILFNIFIFYTKGQTAAYEYFGGYIIELSLSVDNLFLFLMVFSSLKIKEEYQGKVLFYGIVGAMILRLIFILLGVAIISKFSFLLSLFGFILLLSGLKMIFKETDTDFNKSPMIKVIKNIIPITNELKGEKFFVRKNKTIYGTPLLVALLLIEFSDIIFALDSIPAIFSVTTDSFIVYTSNIFAILGLRSMYYILQKMNSIFCLMKYGIGCILIFVGLKLILQLFHIEISTTISILIILSVILTSILLSLIWSSLAKKIKKII